MKIHGIGCDLLEVARVQTLYHRFEERFMRRVLTARECEQAMKQHAPIARLAKYIAAKEAAYKALRTGRGAQISWHHFEVSYAPGGAPKLALSGPAAALLPKRSAVHLSLSDTADHALAYVVIEVMQ